MANEGFKDHNELIEAVLDAEVQTLSEDVDPAKVSKAGRAIALMEAGWKAIDAGRSQMSRGFSLMKSGTYGVDAAAASYMRKALDSASKAEDEADTAVDRFQEVHKRMKV